MIGDVLTSSILFEALKTKFPDSELVYAINSNTYPVVKDNPFIDSYIFISPEIEGSKLKFLKLLSVVRKEGFDVVIDVYAKLSSNLLSLFTGAKMKISKSKWYTSFIYSHPIQYSPVKDTEAGLAIENRMQLLEPLKIKSGLNLKPRIYLTNEEIKEGRTYLEQRKINLNMPLFMISVLGSDQTKTYPFEFMAKVIDLIVEETKGQILFNYIPDQENDARTIYELCSKKSQSHISFSVYGRNLREFLAITRHCSALIGNEGGAINMAKAIEIPTFTIFSPWIDKATWSIFENEKNVSVHLKDYKPELYNSRHESSMKANAISMYKDFSPDLFQDLLVTFLNLICTDDD